LFKIGKEYQEEIVENYFSKPVKYKKIGSDLNNFLEEEESEEES